MARSCELTGKKPMSGNLVSHANNKNRRRFLPNLCNVTLASETLGQRFRLRICANALKSVEHRGGLDAYLIKARASQLPEKALKIKHQIEKKKAEAGSVAAAA